MAGAPEVAVQLQAMASLCACRWHGRPMGSVHSMYIVYWVNPDNAVIFHINHKRSTFISIFKSRTLHAATRGFVIIFSLCGSLYQLTQILQISRILFHVNSIGIKVSSATLPSIRYDPLLPAGRCDYFDNSPIITSWFYKLPKCNMADENSDHLICEGFYHFLKVKLNWKHTIWRIDAAFVPKKFKRENMFHLKIGLEI